MDERAPDEQRGVRGPGDGVDWDGLSRYATEFFAIFDVDGSLRAVSPSVRWVLGYSSAELGRLRPADLIHPGDYEAAARSWNEVVVAPGTVAHADYRMRHEDGAWRWFQVDMHNRTDDPRISGIACHVLDVDERRLVEDELRHSEQRLDALLRNSGGTAVFAATGEVLWLSENGAAPLGLTNEQFINATLASLVHPDDLPIIRGHFQEVFAAPGATSGGVTRMRHADGTWRWLESTYTNCLDQPAVEGIVTNIRDVTERALAEEALRASELALEHQATHDPLTGLPNRTYLLRRAESDLAQAKEDGGTVAVLFVDLDQFKVVNDSQGHATGDRLLVSVAARLRAALPPSDMIARFGGDEFVILRSGVIDAAAAVELAREVLATFELPYALELDDDALAGEAYIDASIGIALSTSATQTPDELIRDADTAMYKAKVLGRGRCELFDDHLRDYVVARHERQVGLRRAIDEQQFEVHFQPIVDLDRSGTTLVGAEALVRWRHPSGRLLSPAGFIEQAEETGLIVPIGRQVLEAACSRWAEMSRDDAFISVNLSARQLAEPSVIDDVAAALEHSLIPGHRLHLEITESALMVDPLASASALVKLKELGVQIAVDDFGTGYSSFAYLRGLPVDCLKIDKMFIDGLADDAREQALVLGMCQLAHTLGLTVVAEGVETAEQLAALRDVNCDLAQGYLFARPVPAEEMGALAVPRL